MNTNILAWLIFFCVLLQHVTSKSYAYDYHGRVSLGGYISREEHEPEPQGTSSNDFATASTRLFYQGNKITDRPLVFTVDLRDKHDFFNKLDRERQELTDNNSFQLRQLSLRHEPNRGFIWEAGRYAIPDAGSSFNDGATLGWSFDSSFSAEAFGGLNPKAYDKSYLEYNADASSYGAIMSYVPKNNSWSTRKELHLAHVTQFYDGVVDRQYLYQQGVVQWSPQSLFSTMVYLDFEPRTYVQNGQVLYNQYWSYFFNSQVMVNVFDVIEYRRVQDLREELQASPYKEVSLKANLISGPTSRWSLQGRYGQRDIDDLERINGLLEVSMPRYFSKNVDFAVRFAQKKEFTKTGSYGGIGIGYFTDRSEYDLSLDAGVEKQTDDTTLHPILVDVNYGHQVSRRYFAAGGIQYQQDEKVKIYTAFLKLTYRFGNKETPPLRDGAPPRGRL